MKCFANVNHGVSVVGDPDQSIYGWRSAEVENLNKMTEGELDESDERARLMFRLSRCSSDLPGTELSVDRLHLGCRSFRCLAG